MNSDLRKIENFVIEKGILYSGRVPENGLLESNQKQFIIVPYHHPAKSKRAIRCFNIENEVQFYFPEETALSRLSVKPVLSRKEYIQKIGFLKDQIQRGNIYEINFCMEFAAENVELDVFTVFQRLVNFTKAPFCRMVKMNDDYILSASPELFLKKENDQLFTKPIKGTIRRGKTSEEDLALKESLFTNEKERTENVMAVDVARNDLSRIARRGTVHVNKLYKIESFETVHQMVSTVSCEIKDNSTIEGILDATFPMASMTGAPKISAMNLIGETESFDRNFYSGAMGFVEENGDFELSVIIRSIFYNSALRRLSFAVGSAITHLCDPEKEYDECLLKANALLRALNAEIKY